MGENTDEYKSFKLVQIGDTAPAMDHVLGLVNGMAAGGVLMAACKLEIFDKLNCSEIPHSAASLAGETGWDADTLERLLDGLVALKLVKKSQAGDMAVYINMDSGNFLRKNGDPCVWESVMWMGKHSQETESLTEEVKTGKHKASSFPAHVTVHMPAEGKEQSHTHGHHHGHGHGHGHSNQSPEALIERYTSMEGNIIPYLGNMLDAIDMTGYTTLVDVGAGSGIIGISMAHRYPSLHVTLFEVEPVINMVKKHFLPKAGDNLNVSLLKGDFFKDDLPPADVYVLGKIVHDWSPDQILVLLKRIMQSINPGGSIVLLEKCLNDNKDGPPAATLWDNLVMSKCAGRLRSSKEYEEMLCQVGFSEVKVVKFEDGCQTDVILAKK